MSFIVSGLDPQPFANLFSLDDAPVGSTMLLVNYEHQPAPTPYRASHAIFVSEDATQTQVRDEIPPALARRILSLRAFDRSGNMTDAAIVPGVESKSEIERMFSDPENVYIHAHYAARGCFAATINRG